MPPFAELLPAFFDLEERMPPFAGLPSVFFALAAFVFGLLVGSFLNVVIYRVPRGESIIYPGSHCGSCGKPVKPYDNIPLLSYTLLGGRCRACKAKISLIYPAVELLTGLLFLAVMLKSGPMAIANTEASFITVMAEMVFVAVIISLIFIDARHKLLPNVITYPAFVLAMIAPAAIGFSHVRLGAYIDFPPGMTIPGLWQATIAGAVLIASAAPIFGVIDRLDDVLFSKYFEWAETDEAQPTPEEIEAERKMQRQHNWVVYGTMVMGVILAIAWIALRSFISEPGFVAVYTELLYSALGALVGGGIVWLLRALYFYTRGAEGMGLGDVKMMAVVGAFLGWQQAIIVLIIGSFLGSIVGLVMARRSKQGLKTALPFGIFLGIGALFALFGGTPLLNWYIGMMR